MNQFMLNGGCTHRFYEYKECDQYLPSQPSQAEWGKIIGNLENQKDLIDYLKNLNLPANTNISIIEGDEPGVLSITINGTNREVQLQKLKNTLENKQDKLVSGSNIKTINGQSLLGEGDININAGAKPENGWRKDDLSQEVKDSLDKADKAESDLTTAIEAEASIARTAESANKAAIEAEVIRAKAAEENNANKFNDLENTINQLQATVNMLVSFHSGLILEFEGINGDTISGVEQTLFPKVYKINPSTGERSECAEFEIKYNLGTEVTEGSTQGITVSRNPGNSRNLIFTVTAEGKILQKTLRQNALIVTNTAKFGTSTLETLTEEDIQKLSESRDVTDGYVRNYSIEVTEPSYIWICLPDKYSLDTIEIPFAGEIYRQTGQIYLNGFAAAIAEGKQVGNYNCYRTIEMFNRADTYTLELRKGNN